MTNMNVYENLYFNMKNPSKYMGTYKERMGMLERDAKIILKGRKVRCKIKDVNSTSGALLVEVKGEGVIEVSSPKSIVLPKRIRKK